MQRTTRIVQSAAGQSSAQYALADYAGDFAKRSYLLGDFGGKRSEWAKKGFTFAIDYNPYFQAVVDCGEDTGISASIIPVNTHPTTSP